MTEQSERGTTLSEIRQPHANSTESLDCMPQGIVILDSRAVVCSSNVGFAKLLDVDSESDIPRKSIADFIDDHNNQEFISWISSTGHPKMVSRHIDVVTKSGREKHLFVTKILQQPPGEEAAGTLLISTEAFGASPSVLTDDERNRESLDQVDELRELCQAKTV